MQLVILAAGRGTRMRPITKDTPKPMVPLLGRPKLAYTLSALPQEIDEVILVVNYLAEQIKNYFGAEYAGRKISYITQKKLDGTGGAIYACKDVLRKNFLVMMGDDLYCPDDIKKIMQHDLAILTFEADTADRFGRVLEDKKGNFQGILENKENLVRPKDSQPALINTALYALNQQFFNYKPVAISSTEFGLPQTLAKMTDRHQIRVLKTKKWVPLGKVRDIAVAEKGLKEVMGKYVAPL